MNRPEKLIYFEVVHNTEDDYASYGIFESLHEAIAHLPIDDPAHIEMITEIHEVVDLKNPCNTCKCGNNKTILRCIECESPWWKNHEPRDLYENTKWIPVSERLPKDRNWYLGIFKEPDTGWINSIPFICDYVGVKTKATTNDYWILRGLTDSDDRIGDYYFNLECVAWMPLPEPYKESEE